MAKVVLAYSGGLDTTICVHYLRHVKGMKVYTFSANLGQPEYLEPLAEQAVELGATAAHLADLRDKFVKDYVHPCIRANAVYEQGYYLFSALSRPLIVKELVAIAEDEGCDVLAHGSRGIGNDKVRLNNAIKALAPDLDVLAPLEELGLRTPADDVAYAHEHGLAIESERRTLYNVEQNLWGNNIQLRGLVDTWEEPPRDTYVMTSPPADAPAKPTVIEVGFERGVPVKLDGEELRPVALVDRLNKIAGRCSVGRFDVIENRIGGLKTRELYEAPAACVLIAAHRALEALTLDKSVLHFKEDLSRTYADLVYQGEWFTATREGLDAFFAKVNEKVTGDVRLSLFKGALAVAGRRSPHSLFAPQSAPWPPRIETKA
jgi:argininosuccinate synthase